MDQRLGAPKRLYRLLGLTVPRAAVGFLPFVVGLTGCERDRALAPLRPSAPALARASAGLPHNIRLEESAFAELAKMVPSSAGFFYDRAGQMVVWVRDSSDAPGVAAAVQNLITQRRIVLSPDKQRAPLVTVRQAIFSFAELAAWRDTIGAYVDVTAGAGIVMLDLDEAINRVTVGVLPTANTVALAAAFQARGVDPRAVHFKMSEPFKFDVASSTAAAGLAALSGNSFRAISGSVLDIRLTQSNMVGGLAIAVWSETSNSGSGCTMGFPVKQSQSGAYYPGFLTASHCTDKLFGFDGDTVSQNDSGPRIGHEKDDPDFYTCGLYHCRASDAAFMVTNAGVPVDQGVIAKFAGVPYNGFQYDTTSMWLVTSDASTGGLYVGTRVNWVGRSTGTGGSGTISNTCTDLWLASNAKVTCDMVDSLYSSKPGDSGGPVFVISGTGNEVMAAGLVDGHVDTLHMYFTPLSRITSDFSGEAVPSTLYFEAPATLAAPTLSAYADANGTPQLSWTAVSGALVYHIYAHHYDSTCADAGATTYSVSSTTWADASVTVVQGGQICPYVTYVVTASTNNAISNASNEVQFLTTQ